MELGCQSCCSTSYTATPSTRFLLGHESRSCHRPRALLQAVSSSDRSSALSSSSAWRPLSGDIIWEGTEAEALAGAGMPLKLSPLWKVMLLSDGSVTRHLQLLADVQVEVESLESCIINRDTVSVPEAVELIQGPLLQRQVLLHLPDPLHCAYVYATSWWSADTTMSYLRDPQKPIWVSLSQERTELFREILNLQYGYAPELEEKFESKGPFWSRQYVFWHNQRPLTVIHEVFSTKLQDFLGPISI